MVTTGLSQTAHSVLARVVKGMESNICENNTGNNNIPKVSNKKCEHYLISYFTNYRLTNKKSKVIKSRNLAKNDNL
ncbi:hypothetical protein NQ317_001303 [Molorchus minor]|uniref:Uncharacterized protein n=1 Tax=Molorchus minor TaxID=1323400 RepID=A0ABQ9JPG1_9CUCU|nr:hypothetical protein NQ317_001303 [Molorchus minor]